MSSRAIPGAPGAGRRGLAGTCARRGVLALPALALAGCGFHAQYGEAARRGPTAAGLESVRVGLIADRSGQLLRRALEDRLGSGGTLPRYDLRVGLNYGFDQEGFRRDGTPSRVRVTATANWFLYDTNVPPRLLRQGLERTFDAYNIPENQFFAADASRLAMERRLADVLAGDVVRRLAVLFESGPPQAA